MINKEIFDFVKIKPLLQHLDMSPSRFTQKLHQYDIRGQKQGFTVEEEKKIKSSLLLIVSIIEEEANKI
mgnify:CR=1 FL=1